MPVLRDLVTRFSFEVDKKSVNRYESTLGGMKATALKLGSVLGLAFGAKSLFNMGVSATQAEQDVKRLAGTNLDQLNNQFIKLDERIKGVRSGAENILTSRTKNILAAGFIETFDNSNESLQTFIKLLEVATLQAGNTGRKVEEVFGELLPSLTGAAKTGFKGLGGLGIEQVKQIEYRAEQQQIGGPAVGIDLATNRRITLDLIDSILPALRTQLQGIDLGVVEKQVVVKTGEEFIQKLSTELFDIGVGILSEGATTIEKNNKILLENRNKRIEPESKTQPINKTSSQNIEKVEININGATDPKAVSNEVERIFNQKLNDAHNQTIRSEDR